MKHFDELYALALSLIALLGWSVNTILGMSLLIVVATIVMLLTNDMKYAIPSIIYSIFTINEGFSNDKIPIPLVIVVSIFVVVLSIQVFRNGIHLKKMKSFIGLAGLAITNIIPIFWADNIPNEYNIFYVFFFSNLAYLVVYVIAVNGIKKDSINLLAHTMTYLGVLMAFECLFKVIELYDGSSIFKLIYYLGWGVCNEAAIMICMSLPFIFYLMAKSSNYIFLAIGHLKVLILLVGVVLTTSRAGVMVFTLEIVSLYTATGIAAEYKKEYRRVNIIYLLIYATMAIIFIKPIIHTIDDIINNLFEMGLSGNGRLELWKTAIETWKSNPRNIIFGPGISSVLEETYTPLGYQIGLIVFHSTIFETLMIGGIIGMICLLIHLFQKFYNLYKTNNIILFIILMFGYLAVDFYGLIDNTYHMYYYMIPLTIILSCVDNLNYINSKGRGSCE